MTFSEDQYKAASSFAYTMIVVDDEPIAEALEKAPTTTVRKPGRKDSAAAKHAPKDKPPTDAKHSHPLDAKGLIKSALDLGLVCSVVNPTGDEVNIPKSVSQAAVRADIVSLDWHMNKGDEGNLASEIIKQILIADEKSGGRLRLIAIYTGNKDRKSILEAIAKRLNSAKQLKQKVTHNGETVTNTTGLRIVWREKRMGNKRLKSALSEAELPKELLREFAKLSNGLLSNVALATISSMRDTTHHVLSKFSAELDGPFFHHRSLLENNTDSMDYAVSIVMSTLKSEVNKSKVISNHATPEAIKRRLDAMPQSPEKFVLHYLNNNKKLKKFTLNSEDVITLIEEGFKKWNATKKDDALKRQDNKQESPVPSKDQFNKNFSTLFSDSLEAAESNMHEFSFLTNSATSEISSVHKETPPRLGLGSVMYSKKDGYFLCLQATCDTVRGTGSFFFIPLDTTTTGSPDIVVPHGEEQHKIKLVALSVPSRSYTKSRAVNFGSIEPSVGYVPIKYNRRDKGYFVTDSKKVRYRWLANLKYKRALRIAQNMTQEITRIGFDEFEPFRSK
ncbi:response regulator receiver domain [Thalassospira lohafexi]|uniref:Response receiver domain-containing protein n=1 Tax=Thalassospira lohafexi TaxID=744227 RepID=A0A2N3L111_9PROT|nr:response regulator receiver domain [Thalassospira lohafexi]PKR56502.1 hypothetical protein COO92_20695 [Thalassospira lohafexi]